MKKSITVSVLLLIFLALALKTSAAGTMNIAIDNSFAKPGEDAVVTLYLENNPGITYLSVTVVYDTDTLKIKNAQNGSIIPVMTPGLQYIWSSDRNATGNGTLLTLTFSVTDTAKPDDYDVTAIVRGCNNYDEQKVTCTVTAGKVTVICPHTDTKVVAETPANCKDSGFTEGIWCNMCGRFISGHDVIPKTNIHTYGQYVTVDAKTHKRVCTVCGREETGVHEWDNGVVTKEPTCKEDGVKTYTCKDCGATRTEPVPKTQNHSFGKWVKVDDAKHKRVCTVCGREETGAHEWDNGVVTKEPTCKEDGVKTYTCKDCGATRTESVPKTQNHSFGKWIKVDDTKHKRVCTVCGKEETSAHEWDNGVITIKPAHLKEGEKTYTCKICGATKTEPVPKTQNHSFGEWVKHDESRHKRVCECGETEYENHKWDNGKITVAPDCVHKGRKVFKCTVCGAVRTIELPANNEHKWKNAEYADEDGHTYECKLCGLKLYEKHEWDEGVITRMPSPSQDGEITYTCRLCGGQKKEKTEYSHVHRFGNEWKYDEVKHWHECECGQRRDEQPHKFGETAVIEQPSHTKTGLGKRTCEICGCSVEIVLKKTEAHEFGEWKRYDDSRHIRKCACGAAEYADHNYGDWIVVIPATESKDGTEKRVCRDCGAVLERKIPKIPVSTTVPSTETDGKTETAPSSGTDGIGCSGCGSASPAGMLVMLIPVCFMRKRRLRSTDGHAKKA